MVLKSPVIRWPCPESPPPPIVAATTPDATALAGAPPNTLGRIPKTLLAYSNRKARVALTFSSRG